MTAARCAALTICVLGIAPVLAAPPVPLGDPFSVRHGESVELTHGVKLKFIGVTSDGRCPADVTCVWQGEAFVEIELQVQGQTTRGSITTEKTDQTLLAHHVKLLGLYPAPRRWPRRAATSMHIPVQRNRCAPTGRNVGSPRTSRIVAACVR